MQLNDVIKSIGWYLVFVTLLIQIDITKNSISTDTGIRIGASLIKTAVLVYHSATSYNMVVHIVLFIVCCL